MFEDVTHFSWGPPQPLYPPSAAVSLSHKNNGNCVTKWLDTLLRTLVEILPMNIYEFGGMNMVCTFKGGVIWKILSHAVLCWQKQKQLYQNSKIWNFTKLWTVW